ncbi:MAG: hypothetical protein JWO03_374 [Bacteroidetes bacterium]|nr:hypothetical protein [Bacteroidota bacterium]
MKHIFTLFFCATLVSNIAFGQAPIPNGDFENWSNSSGADHPSGWSTSDQIVTGLPFGLSSPGGVSQEANPANVASGSYSALLNTRGVAIPTLGTVTFAGSMTLGTYGFTLSNFQTTLGGVAYADRPDSIEFSYKYLLPVGAIDSGIVRVNLTRATPHDGTVTVGTATVYAYYSSSFTTTKAKINYFSALDPDTLKIQAQSSAALFMGGADNAQLWLDDMHFTGLDTIFKAYLFPKTSQVVCAGDPIAIRTDEIPGDSYVWFRDGNTLPNTAYKITPAVSGGYSVLVSHEGALYVSDTIYVTVNPLPVVVYSGPQDTVCDNGGTVELSGGIPAGGTYAGTGVRSGVFNPANAPLGDRDIRYTYTDNNGCSATSDNLSFYVAGCSLGVDVLQSYAQINVYPNPAFNTLFITGNNKVVGSKARMYDVQGRLLMVADIQSDQTAVDLSGMSAGCYTLIVSDSANTLLAKAKVVVAR